MPPLPTLRQLRYLVALADERHFGRAAELCHVTQSTLSFGLQELEQIVGVRLIERGNRRVVPTLVGQDVVERARRILRETEELADAARAAGAPMTGALRIGLIPTVGPFLVPRILPRLQADYPAMRPYLREEQSARLIAALEDGRLDVLVLAFPYDAPEIASNIFLDDPFWLACPAGHRLARQAAVDPREVPEDELLLLEDGHCLRDHALAACGVRESVRHEGFRGTSLYTLVHMVAAGLGVTLLPDLAVKAGVAAVPGVVARPLTAQAPCRRIGLAWRRTSPRVPEYLLLSRLFGNVVRPGGS